MGDYIGLNAVSKLLALANECVRKGRMYAAEYFFDKADEVAKQKAVAWEQDRTP